MPRIRAATSGFPVSFGVVLGIDEIAACARFVKVAVRASPPNSDATAYKATEMSDAAEAYAHLAAAGDTSGNCAEHWMKSREGLNEKQHDIAQYFIATLTDRSGLSQSSLPIQVHY